MKDLFGQALLDYQTNNLPENLITATNISEEDEMEVAYLFREFDQMPLLEQKALQLSCGKVLDVGCGAGSHSLYLQNHKKLEVLAVDISANAIQTCRLRGVQNAEVKNILELKNQKFDTILLLMNGTGIFRTLAEAPKYLEKLKDCLLLGGQILIDSSDLIYMFDQDDDGGKWIDGSRYYGELTFTVSYKKQTELPFEWLYLDFNTLQNLAVSHGFLCEIVAQGTHFDYLARLTHA